jgi:hypothetical protein
VFITLSYRRDVPNTLPSGLAGTECAGISGELFTVWVISMGGPAMTLS